MIPFQGRSCSLHFLSLAGDSSDCTSAFVWSGLYQRVLLTPFHRTIFLDLIICSAMMAIDNILSLTSVHHHFIHTPGHILSLGIFLMYINPPFYGSFLL